MKKIKIDPFKPAWWAFWALVVAVIALFTKLFENASFDTKRLFLVILAGISILYFVFYKYILYKSGATDFLLPDELPLHLCNLGTIFAFVGAFTCDEFLLGYCACVSTFGAFMALLMPLYLFRDVEVFSPQAIGFYGHHALIIINGALIYTLGMYDPEPAYTWKLVLFCGALVTVVHFINLFIRKVFHTKANYMFTCDTEHNAVLDILYKLIPIRLVYVYPLLPVVAVLHTFLIMFDRMIK